MATYESQKRHLVCFTKNFNFQKQIIYIFEKMNYNVLNLTIAYDK
jgi:hypothetical protein